MKTHRYILSAVVSSFLVAAQGFAGSFLFEVKNVPTGNQTCAQTARAAAERLVAIANVKVNRSYCISGDRSFDDLHVVYEAPQALTVIDSLNHNSVDVGIGQGIYKSLADCQKELSSQQTEFATMTGSHIVAAFCSTQSFSGSHPYYPTIAAVVMNPESKQRLMYQTLRIFGKAPTDAEALAKTFTDKLRAQGVNVRRVVLADDPADARLQVSYYATQEIKFDAKRKLDFESTAVCQARTASVVSAFNQIGAQLYVTFCSPNEYTHSTKLLTVAYMPTKEVVWTTVPGVYMSRKECEDDQAHMEDIYRAQGLAVAGSACSFNKNYQLVILSGK